MTTPLLILSDAPASGTGLGRICKELAVRVATHLPDVYRVGTLGYGGIHDRHLPFHQYHIESMRDWFIPTLQEVWENFAGQEHGIILVVWDPSRVLWFARPELGTNPDKAMVEWLKKPPFEKWIYAPQDAAGPHNELSVMVRECLLGFDRVLAYSQWSEDTIRRSVDEAATERWQLTAIPHGIDTTIFRPHRPDREVFKSLGFTGIQPEDKIVGIVATNQARKDFGLAFEALQLIAKEQPIKVFIQTDILERNWSIPALVYDFGLQAQTLVNTTVLSDELMARIYSACDVTLGIGAGEGFGFSTFESLACGTPHITGTYGGQAEHLTENLTTPFAFRFEGLYNCQRPVYDPAKWAWRINRVLAGGKTGKSLLPPRLAWNNLWKDEWEPWFRAGQIRHLQADSLAQSDNTREMDTDLSHQSRSRVASAEDYARLEAAQAAPWPDPQL